jgi:hypothetical protein
MTQSKGLLVSAAVIALLFGLEFPDPKLIGEPSPLPNNHTMILAAEGQNPKPQAQTEENADESAKMDQDAGAQTSDKATVPESDTKKANQPPGAHPGNAN